LEIIMTPFGPRQEPTERPLSKGHPHHPHPAGQYAVPPQTDPPPARQAQFTLPRAAWWSLIIVAAIVLIVLLIGIVLYV
jgi:hypothetical protein